MCVWCEREESTPRLGRRAHLRCDCQGSTGTRRLSLAICALVGRVDCQVVFGLGMVRMLAVCLSCSHARS